MNWMLPVLAAISSLPSSWWTRGPGLPDPPPLLNRNRLVVAGLTLAGGLGAAAFAGSDTMTRSLAAFAAGRIAGRIGMVALNPQPLPPKTQTA